jgi:hypothetical protein
VIDDFESYWGTPALQMVWSDSSPGPSTASGDLLIGGAPQGNQQMQLTWNVAGGWQDPADPTNLSSWENSFYGLNVGPLDWTGGGTLHLTVQGTANSDYSTIPWVLLEYGGDQYAQTWIPGIANAGVQFWMDPATVPAILGNDGDVFPNWGGVHYPGYALLPIVSQSNQVELVITQDMYVPWSDPGGLGAFAAMDHISLAIWNQASDTSATSKMDGTDTVYPVAPWTGSWTVDNIWFEVPEPMTIGLLGLGGLALIRRKR